MDSDKLIYTEFYSKVEKALSDKSNVNKLVDMVSKYMDRNSHILFSLNFSQRLVVSGEDKNRLFEILDIKEKDVEDVIKKTAFAKVDWVMKPFTVLLALCIRYFSINKMQRETELCALYVSFLFYTLLHAKTFKFLPNKEIMDYTLHKNPNLTNNFIIKREGTIFGMIRYTVMTSHQLYEEELIKNPTDKVINDYLSSIRTRIRSNLVNIMKYFKEDHRQGNYFNKDTDSEEEGNFHLADSTTLFISKLTNKVSMNLLSYRFNKKFIEYAAKADYNVSENTLSFILENILEQFRLDIEPFVSAVIELFLIDGENTSVQDIPTKKFLLYSLNLYKTNSTKPRVIKIKEYLDKWIANSTMRYGIKLTRSATISSYRKAIFTVFIYSIFEEAKPK